MPMTHNFTASVYIRIHQLMKHMAWQYSHLWQLISTKCYEMSSICNGHTLRLNASYVAVFYRAEVRIKEISHMARHIQSRNGLIIYIFHCNQTEF